MIAIGLSHGRTHARIVQPYAYMRYTPEYSSNSSRRGEWTTTDRRAVFTDRSGDRPGQLFPPPVLAQAVCTDGAAGVSSTRPRHHDVGCTIYDAMNVTTRVRVCCPSCPQERLIYFNDARHFHLFVHEPGDMNAVLAAAPVDEIAGCGVTTFSYGVSRSAYIHGLHAHPHQLLFWHGHLISLARTLQATACSTQARLDSSLASTPALTSSSIRRSTGGQRAACGRCRTKGTTRCSCWWTGRITTGWSLWPA